MGIGFPAMTGGAAQFMTGYENTTGQVGLGAFVARADELAESTATGSARRRTCASWPPPAARSPRSSVGVLLLVRHGQASFGTADYDVLSETGWEQGRLLGDWLRARGVTPTAVVRGGMRRHRETAEAAGVG